MERRDFLATAAGFATFALLGEVGATSHRGTPAAWISRQAEIARALSAGEIHPRQWMSDVERLAREVDVEELMATVQRAHIASAGEPFHNDPRKRFVRFVDESGAQRRLPYGVALFDFNPRNVVTPHGHRHMVSAHLVVAGRFRVRTFDRIGDRDGAMVIRPTGDRLVTVGEVSAMSSERDNIHWFVPRGGPAATFDVVVSGLDKGAPDHEIRAIDPLGGERLADGSIVAPVIEFGKSSKIYTADV